MTSRLASTPRNSNIHLQFLCLVLFAMSCLRNTIKERLMMCQQMYYEKGAILTLRQV